MFEMFSVCIKSLFDGRVYLHYFVYSVQAPNIFWTRHIKKQETSLVLLFFYTLTYNARGFKTLLLCTRDRAKLFFKTLFVLFILFAISYTKGIDTHLVTLSINIRFLHALPGKLHIMDCDPDLYTNYDWRHSLKAASLSLHAHTYTQYAKV